MNERSPCQCLCQGTCEKGSGVFIIQSRNHQTNINFAIIQYDVDLNCMHIISFFNLNIKIITMISKLYYNNFIYLSTNIDCIVITQCGKKDKPDVMKMFRKPQ